MLKIKENNNLTVSSNAGGMSIASLMGTTMSGINGSMMSVSSITTGGITTTIGKQVTG